MVLRSRNASDCKKTPYGFVRNVTLRNLHNAFILSGSSMLVMKQAELHLVHGALEGKRPVWEVLKDHREDLGVF